MFGHPKYSNGVFLWIMILAFLLLGRHWTTQLLAESRPAPRRAPRHHPDRAPVALPVANVAWGHYLAFWIGAISGRLWREFYFWTVGDNDSASGVA